MLCCLTVLSGESHCEHTLCCAEVALCIWHMCCAELCCMCGMHAVLRCIKQQSKDADQPCPALYNSCLKRTGLKRYETASQGHPSTTASIRIQDAEQCWHSSPCKQEHSIAVLRLHPFAATDHGIVTFLQAAACRGVLVCGTDCFELQCPILPVLLFIPTVL